eukprot:Sspe_Gene.59920::Locus_32956_Transcript_1_1_Confidence_1.000_Length_1128::g.59920::m.59920
MASGTMYADPTNPKQLQRSRSWTGRTRTHSSVPSVRSQSPASRYERASGMSSCSRYDMNQSMRERGAALWLDHLRQSHERRREAAQRSQEIQEMQRTQTLSKIRQQEANFNANRRVQAQYQKRRSEAFVSRQEYLKQAKEHANMMQEVRQVNTEHELAMRLQQADQNHQHHLQAKQLEAVERNNERHMVAAQNQQAIEMQREAKRRSLELQEELRQQKIQQQRMQEEQQRRHRAESHEEQRHEALARAEQLQEIRRMQVEGKLMNDFDKSATVLKKREDWLRQRQQANQERQQMMKEQVAHANAIRQAKEKQYDAHFQESLAIGKETAEHNKLFKLNNRIMHELMQDMIHNA